MLFLRTEVERGSKKLDPGHHMFLETRNLPSKIVHLPEQLIQFPWTIYVHFLPQIKVIFV